MNNECDIAIVGGGAAGLAAAVAAGRAAQQMQRVCHIVVLEQNDRVGKSILATGNGRCNFSNAHVATGEAISQYHNADLVRDVLASLAKAPTSTANAAGDPVLAFLESCGLAWRTEDDGRRYPLANKASVVSDALRATAERVGVQQRCGCRVESIELPRTTSGLFTLHLAHGEWFRARAVVIACGGAAVTALAVEGLDASPSFPLLGPLRCSAASIKDTREMDNIRVKGGVSLLRSLSGSTQVVAVETGEVLFRSYGLSGICIFNLSRFARAHDTLSINLLPVPPVDARAFMAKRHKRLTDSFGAALTCEDLLRGLVLPRVADVVCKQAGLALGGACGSAEAGIVADTLAHFTFEVEGIVEDGAYQVHRGGYAPSAFNSQTLASVEHPGLYAAGEAVDVDGPCGGFNLHWAWASGMRAGMSAMDYIASVRSDARNDQGERAL